MKRILFSGLLALALFPVAVRATSDTYENDGTVLSPPDVAPQIDATNFVNTGSFTVDLPLTLTTDQYKTANTVNYTNTGTMSAEWGFDLETFPGPKMAASFYNSGTINGGFLAGSSIIISGVGLSVRMIVSATNISNPGNINMGSDSLLKLTGQSLDLSRSILTTAGGSTVSTLDYGVGQCPLSNTVVFPFFAWDPSVYLGQNYAYSSIFTNHLRQELQEYLINSTPYSAIQSVSISNVITRAIFLQNNNPAVTTRVFIEPNDLGGGYGHVEWAGSYVDTATDLQFTNYFYLSDIFVRTTNATSIPDGFSFMQNNGTPLFLGAATPTGMPAFDPGNVTNLYSYISVLAIPGTADTNSVVGGNVTNLPGRIQISASRDLDLTLAQISGPNYLLLESTNQFKGNNGSTISASYADIRLGVTNGFLTISNLWKPTIPVWNGPIQAWNTRWFTVTTNVAFTITNSFTITTNLDLPPTFTTNFTFTTNSVGWSVTNDYRVLLVNSTLVPIAPTYVQDLVLHATNTLTISDTFNILRTLSIDAQSLTLTTNAYGHGANSAAGELNLIAPNYSWAAATPRLRSLTNSGAIRITGQGSPSQSFGSALPGGNYLAWINNGLISDAGSTIWVDNFQNNGTILNASGSFTLHALNATMTNGSISAGGDITFITPSLSSSNLSLQAGRTLTLTVTDRLTDNGVTNGNIWIVGNTSGGGGNNALALTIKPALGDLLGTTIMNNVPGPNKQVFNVWAGQDRGVSTSGYTNNAAVGRLILDSFGQFSEFVFNGRAAGESNALYVDYLELRDYATTRDGSGNFPALNINSNLVIYYAQAIISGASIAEKMNHKNNDHLRWVAAYAGTFSSTNIVIGGVTNTVNAALAQSTDIDSDSDGTNNAADPTPFFLSSQVNFTITLTNQPPLTTMLKWFTIPHATNYVEFRTNLLSVNWLPLTNFPSPVYQNQYGTGPATNVVVFDPVNFAIPRYYRVVVDTWLTYPF